MNLHVGIKPILLRAESARQDCPNIVINSPYTDVFKLALSKYRAIDIHLYLLTGVKDKRRIIDIQAVADKEYQSINLKVFENSMFLDGLVDYHCFTGCDSITALAGRRKIKPFVLTCKRLDHMKPFSRLEKYEELPDGCLKEMENFVCFMHGGGRVSEGNVTELRYKIYCQVERLVLTCCGPA